MNAATVSAAESKTIASPRKTGPRERHSPRLATQENANPAAKMKPAAQARCTRWVRTHTL